MIMMMLVINFSFLLTLKKYIIIIIFSGWFYVFVQLGNGTMEL